MDLYAALAQQAPCHKKQKIDKYCLANRGKLDSSQYPSERQAIDRTWSAQVRW